MERPEDKRDEPAGDDRLGDVRPLSHDEDERPSREDRDYGSTIFTPPDWLRPRRKRGRKKDSGA
jgi:hypothetical protein